MAAESEQPTPRERSTPTDPDASRGRAPEQHERVGPLTLLRTSKADGRALLLFSRAGREREA
jgi:hypothetical protein